MDITKLDGYKPEMTDTEKVALIQGYELPAPTAPDDTEAKKWKAQFDKTASELAAANKTLKAKMTEDEQKEAERIAKDVARDAELDQLRKETAVSKNKSNYIGLGYDDKLADDTAQALADGDMAKVFANQSKHQEAILKATKAESLAGGSAPGAGQNRQVLPRDEMQKQYDNAVASGKTAEAIALKNKIFTLDSKPEQ